MYAYITQVTFAKFPIFIDSNFIFSEYKLMQTAIDLCLKIAYKELYKHVLKKVLVCLALQPVQTDFGFHHILVLCIYLDNI